MIIIKLQLLHNFATKHASTRKSLATWVKITEMASWNKKQDVLVSFPNAKIVANNRARFEIVHNKYRLIAEIYYGETGLMFVLLVHMLNMIKLIPQLFKQYVSIS